jgi:molecular chaperone HscB
MNGQTPHSCWSCRGPISGPVSFCPTCQVIQPPNPLEDYFTIFSIPIGFRVDADRVESFYRTLQQQFHPDKFATKSPTERRFSLEHITRINEGYRTLGDPLSLSLYLLQRAGRPMEDGSGGASADPSFLMEVMELREGLEELDLQGDRAGEALDAMREDVEGRCGEEIGALEGLFADFFEKGDEGILETIAGIVDRLRYHNKFLIELDQREESLF